MTLPWTHATLVFQSHGSTVLLLAALAGAVAAGLWLNRPTLRTLGRIGLVLVAAEVLAALFVVLWMVNPRLRYSSRGEPGGEVALLVDDSLSMDTADTPGGRTRFEAARQLLFAPDSPARRALESFGRPRVFTLGGGLREYSLSDFPSQADPTGYGTNLAEALTRLGTEARVGRLRAIVLASDGVQTDPGDPIAAARQAGVPVLTIGVGRASDGSETSDRAWCDVAVNQIDVPTRVTVGQEVALRVKLAQVGMNSVLAPVELRSGEKTLATATAMLNAPEQEATLRFTPAVKGTQTYTVAIPHLDGDGLAADDSQQVTIMATDRKLRVLYVEGTLRWNYTFLHRILANERTIQADCVVLTGPGQITQQGEGDLKLRGGLPADEATLQRYDVLILGDFPPAMLDAAGLALLDRFVKEKKGGLLVVGGQNLLGSGRFAGSPLEALLPARVSRVPIQAITETLTPELTASGRGSSVLKGLESYFPRLALQRLWLVESPKPGAETWLEAGRRPLLLAQRYGEGRTMLLTGEDLWTAALHESGPAEGSPSAPFWIQAIDWLGQREAAAGSHGEDPLLMARVNQSVYKSGEPVQLEAWLRRSAAPDAGWGKVTGQVLSGGQVAATLDLPAPNAEGRVDVSWRPPRQGAYTIRLHAAQGSEQADVDCHLNVGSPFDELARRAMDESTLREIARVSGGGYYSLATAPAIGAAMTAESLAGTRLVERDLLDSPAWFVVFLGLVAADWIARRRRNLI